MAEARLCPPQHALQPALAPDQFELCDLGSMALASPMTAAMLNRSPRVEPWLVEKVREQQQTRRSQIAREYDTLAAAVD